LDHCFRPFSSLHPFPPPTCGTWRDESKGMLLSFKDSSESNKFRLLKGPSYIIVAKDNRSVYATNSFRHHQASHRHLTSNNSTLSIFLCHAKATQSWCREPVPWYGLLPDRQAGSARDGLSHSGTNPAKLDRRGILPTSRDMLDRTAHLRNGVVQHACSLWGQCVGPGGGGKEANPRPCRSPSRSRER